MGPLLICRLSWSIHLYRSVKSDLGVRQTASIRVAKNVNICERGKMNQKCLRNVYWKPTLNYL
jgi:hypothetical protein